MLDKLLDFSGRNCNHDWKPWRTAFGFWNGRGVYEKRECRKCGHKESREIR